MIGSHHGDPSLSQTELDTCLALVDWIKKQRSLGAPDTWTPNTVDILGWVLPNVSYTEFQTCIHMVRWVNITVKERSQYAAQHEHTYDPTWLPGNVDMLKSRLFWRLRSGKQPLASPPPTAFSCPWYELIEDDRAHWAYDCHVHKPGEPGLWGKNEFATANIGQCSYKVETWSDTEETIPFSVSFGPYLFRTFLGPFETHQFDPNDNTFKVITLDGWWIKHVKDPLAPHAFDLTKEELPYKIGQSRD